MKYTVRTLVAVGAAGIALSVTGASASPVLFGDYYRLGENDPGAGPGNLGNATTVDSGLWQLDLTRSGTPTYSADTAARAVGSKLSMSFVNNSAIVGPTGPSYYSRSSATAATLLQAGYGLETWVKTSTLTPDDASGYAVIAAVGDPFGSGFGILQHGGDYVVRVGKDENVLTSASTTIWTHLAYVRTFNTDDFFVNGELVGETTLGTAAVTSADTFALAADVFDAQHPDLFNGLIDETRLFTDNPMAAGAFNPAADFLITPVPEPSVVLIVGCAVLLVARRRTRL
ncbi:MAG: LamG-like jellyroll fold domain-containing protein [Tepidisphaerales bacterium]